MFWQIIIVLSAVAAVFILWPLVQLPFLHKSWLRHASQDETQVTLYHEHLADLDKSLQRGDVDQTQYEQLRVELQKTLVADEIKTGEAPLNRKGKKVVLALAVLLPVAGFLMYNHWGAKHDWEIFEQLQSLPLVDSQEAYEQQLRELVLKSQARLNQTPDNFALRNLLAQTSMALQDYDEAVANYRKILEIFPESPQIMANLAQALFYRAGNTITPEVREYTQKSLAIAPMIPEMLGLAGIDAKNQGDLRGAIRYWKLAVSQLDPHSQSAQGYKNGIQKAEQALLAAGETLDEPAQSSEDKPGASADLASVVANVTLAKDVKVTPSTTVFVYARAWQGPKMPLAIQKLTVQDLPMQVRLDESMAMAPGMTIKQFDQLELVARISKSGTPAPQSGDWQGSVGPIKLNDLDGPVALTISEQVP